MPSIKVIRDDFIRYYLVQNKCRTLLSFLKNFNLKYYIEKYEYAKFVRNCKDEYQYLKYDDFGMVSYDYENFNVNIKRWNDKHLDKPILYNEYVYLDSISKYCQTNQINLYFFQSPFRSGLYTKLDDKENEILNAHIIKINNILSSRNQFFVNSLETVWSDSLFVDAIHFNGTGAKIFTEYCFNILNEYNPK